MYFKHIYPPTLTPNSMGPLVYSPLPTSFFDILCFKINFNMQTAHQKC